MSGVFGQAKQDQVPQSNVCVDGPVERIYTRQ